MAACPFDLNQDALGVVNDGQLNALDKLAYDGLFLLDRGRLCVPQRRDVRSQTSNRLTLVRGEHHGLLRKVAPMFLVQVLLRRKAFLHLSFEGSFDQAILGFDELVFT
jgi:hypothetical protein